MQMVVLVGGLGTRLRPLTDRIPKSLVRVNERPFLDYQLALFRDAGFRDIVLCAGYLAEQIEACFGDGRGLGLRIRYGVERNGLLGTAGAVRQAEHLLDEEFFLTYGDSYLVMDYGGLLRSFRRQGKLAAMVVYRNDDRLERSNVVIEDGLVKAYDKERRLPGMRYINFGVSLLRKDALRLVPAGVPYSQEDWYGDLIERRELLAFETEQRFYEIGSPQGLREFRSIVAAGALP